MAESSSSYETRNLPDIVLSWSFDNILDDNLLLDEVQRIPDTFSSVEHYLKSFMYPIVEEIRAELALSLKNLAYAPYADVLDVNSGRSINVDKWKNKITTMREHESSPEDVLLISPVKPECLLETCDLRESCVLGWVKRISGQSCLQIEGQDGFAFDLKKKFYVIFLANFTVKEKAWESLHTCSNLEIIDSIRCPGNISVDGCCSKPLTDDLKNDINTRISCLDRSQLQAIRAAVADALCKHKCSVSITWGPPGTGKTKTMIFLIYVLSTMSYRILACAPTDEAITEVARLFEAQMKSFYGNKSSVKAVNNVFLYGDDLRGTDDACIENASVVFCSVQVSWNLRKTKPFECLVIDDAEQIKEYETNIPFQVPGINKLFLFGDHFLPSTSLASKVSENAWLGRSLFERMMSENQTANFLATQYRMHPRIIFFPNSMFYDSLMLDGYRASSKHQNQHFLSSSMFGPYSFINVSCGVEEFDKYLLCHKNIVQAAVVMKIVQKLFREWKTAGNEINVGILSPYRAQEIFLREKLSDKYTKYEGFTLKVKSIDEFSGERADVIILSTVRSNNNYDIGCLSNDRLVNLCLTRARHHLWIVGDEKTLTSCDHFWRMLVDDAKHRRCFYDAEQDQSIAKAILQIIEELNLLNDAVDTNNMLFENARWKVLFSDRFKRSFQKLNTEEMKKMVICYVMKLSTGWKPKRNKSDTLCDESLKMLRKHKVNDHWIVVSVDIEKEDAEKGEEWCQILRIWDIMPEEDIPHLVHCLKDRFLHYSSQYRSLCQERCLQGNLVVPFCWPSSDLDLECHRGPSSIGNARNIEKCKINESIMLMKFYSFTCKAACHMLSGCDGKEVDIPFELTDQETAIIKSESTSFVLGRSGTGKTTVIITKLFQREQLYHIASQGIHNIGENPGEVLRQMFVTVNPRLCFAVKEQLKRFNRYTCAVDAMNDGEANDDVMDETTQFSDIPDSFLNLPMSSYPLVITYRKLLMMLDGSIGTSYFNRYADVISVSRGDYLPQSSLSATVQTLILSREVTFSKFRLFYWPHINSQLTKSLEPSSVFKEIVSHIKGGSHGGPNSGAILSRTEYLQLNEKRWSTSSMEDREKIYNIFEKYESLKRNNFQYDLADLVIDLRSRFAKEKYCGEMMNFVYVDEIQDLTTSQISILKHVCKNWREGFFFTGDTAQAIAEGVDFRFPDIKSLFYREFIPNTITESSKRKGLVDPMLYLHQNYRTHMGILKLAQCIVDILYELFPFSIDHLPPETSHVDGDIPLLIEIPKRGTSFISQFLSSFDHEQNTYAFGAEQVILVRDETVKNDLLNETDNKALILTVMECKGLEFQDVLLYNFSKSSTERSWRLLHDWMQLKEQNNCSEELLSWDSDGKHKNLCSALKQLYVAITRTRQRLWIVEDDGFDCPIFHYWQEKKLVQIRELDSDFAKEMRAPSSLDEWKSRGMKLFRQQNYRMAKICFEECGDRRMLKLTTAAELRSEADSTRLSATDQVKLTKAATIYESISKYECAAQCHVELTNFKEAGDIYLKYLGVSKLEAAAECFYLAKDYEKAAMLYDRANKFTRSISACLKGNLFEVGWIYFSYWVDKNGHKSSYDDNVESFLEKGASFYYAEKELDSMSKFVQAFPPKDSFRNFLKRRKLYDELIQLEIKAGYFLLAAEAAEMKGDVIEEARLRGKGGQREQACNLILSHVLNRSLWLKGAGWPLISFDGRDALLREAKELASQASHAFFKYVSTEADALSGCDFNSLDLRKTLPGEVAQHNDIARIVSVWITLDHYLSSDASCLREDLFRYSRANFMRWYEVSAFKLIRCWDIWRVDIAEVCNSLSSFLNDEDNFSDFSMRYFGLRKRRKNDKVAYSLIYDDIEWINFDEFKPCLRRDSKTVVMKEIAPAATNHFCSLVLRLGTILLRKLKELHSLSVEKELPLFCQTMFSVYMFNVAKYLSNFEASKDNDFIKRMLKSAKNVFARNMFRIDWRSTLDRDMIFLKEKHECWEIMKSVASDYVSLNAFPANEVAGRTIAFWLSGFVFEDRLRSISNLCMRGIRSEPSLNAKTLLFWSDITFSKESFAVRKLHRVLIDAWFGNVEASNNYMQPCDFVRIAERLIVLIFAPMGFFRGTKSCVLDWLSYERWHVEHFLEAPLCRVTPFFDNVVYNLVGLIADILRNVGKTKGWTAHFKMDITQRRWFLLRLIAILYLLCANSSRHFDVLRGIIGRPEIAQLLPWDFTKYFTAESVLDSEKCVSSVCQWLQSAGNSIVSVALTVEAPAFHNAISLDLRNTTNKKAILSILNQKRRK